MHWLFLLSLFYLTSCGQPVKVNGTVNLVKVNQDKTFYTYQKTAFYLMKDSVKVDPLDYDLTLNGKGQFIRLDSLVRVTALEQALTLIIQEKRDTQNHWRIKLQPRQNPHFSKSWKEFGAGDTPGFTDRDAYQAFRNYIDLRLLDHPVPEFQKETVSGRQITHESFKGHVTLINFWYYGCRPCMFEIPALNKLKSVYKDDDRVQFLAFFKDSIALTDNYQRLYKSQMFGSRIPEMAPISAYPIEPHPEKFDVPQVLNSGEITKLFNVRGFPTTMIIDENGIIRYIQVGILKPDNFPASIFKKFKRKIEQFSK